MYKQTNINLYTSNFFVLTDQNNVYKCLYNNKGGQSTVKIWFFYNTFAHQMDILGSICTQLV